MITQALSTKQLYPALSFTKDVFDHNNYGNENAKYINSFFIANSKPFQISKKVPETKLLKEMSVNPSPKQILKLKKCNLLQLKIHSKFNNKWIRYSTIRT